MRLEMNRVLDLLWGNPLIGFLCIVVLSGAIITLAAMIIAHISYARDQKFNHQKEIRTKQIHSRRNLLHILYHASYPKSEVETPIPLSVEKIVVHKDNIWGMSSGEISEHLRFFNGKGFLTEESVSGILDVDYFISKEGATYFTGLSRYSFEKDLLDEDLVAWYEKHRYAFR